MQTKNSFAELLRRTELTCKARYHAARRLNSHGWFSQWTLALLAIGQIVISLAPTLGIQTNLSTQYVNFMGIFFGILVLAYSLLLGMGNHIARSIKLHQCGLELGLLARQLYLLVELDQTDTKQYEQLASKYYEILEKYENHSRVDYLVAHLEYYGSEARGRPVSKRYVLEMYLLHIIQFVHYIFSVLLISFWIVLLVRH